MSEIEVGQVWTGNNDILITGITQTPDGIQVTVRDNDDPQGTWYNLSEQRLRDFYSLRDHPLPEQSQCTKCGAINEYVQQRNYVCYKCRSGF